MPPMWSPCDGGLSGFRVPGCLPKGPIEKDSHSKCLRNSISKFSLNNSDRLVIVHRATLIEEFRNPQFKIHEAFPLTPYAYRLWH